MIREFHAWLVLHGSSVRSADSYCSAVRKVNERYCRNLLPGNDIFDILESSLSDDALTLLYCVEGLVSADIEAMGRSPKKDLQDKRCKWRRFIEFLSGKSEDNAAAMPGDVRIFTRKGLQSWIVDRFSEGIRIPAGNGFPEGAFIPVREIRSLAACASGLTMQQIMRENGLLNSSGRVPDFREIVETQLCRLADNVVLHTANREYRLGEIDGMKFIPQSREVSVIINGHALPLTSATADRSAGGSGKSRPTVHRIRKRDIKSLRFSISLDGRSPGVAALVDLTATVEKAVIAVRSGNVREAAPLIPRVITFLHLILPELKIYVN